jgi:hypothetical protein
MELIFVICIAVGIIIFLLGYYAEEPSGVIGGVLTVFLGIIALVLLSREDASYKQGQIDALTGKVKYELVTKPDSTKSWEEKGSN